MKKHTSSAVQVYLKMHKAWSIVACLTIARYDRMLFRMKVCFALSYTPRKIAPPMLIHVTRGTIPRKSVLIPSSFAIRFIVVMKFDEYGNISEVPYGHVQKPGSAQVKGFAGAARLPYIPHAKHYTRLCDVQRSRESRCYATCYTTTDCSL